NPFQGNTADTSLISLLTNVANTLSYNRFSAIWGVDFTQVANTNKAILTYGFETRTLQDYTLRIRRNFGRQWITDLTLKTGNQALATPNPKFDNRNFSFNTLSVAPGISYIKGTTFRVQTQYRYDAKTGEAGGQPQQSLRHALSTDVRYNVLQKSVINTKLIYSHINFEGTPNSTVGFIMLEGLQPGNNIQWNIDFTRRLNNSLELSMQYEGRQAANTRTVHIGRASLRAIL
ncbi:MAG TPA: hypothetical protein PKD90_19820, partial [Phnomibacter sp.]|nr:hypothetical protein [Phnomibacter sp.]